MMPKIEVEIGIGIWKLEVFSKVTKAPSAMHVKVLLIGVNQNEFFCSSSLSDQIFFLAIVAGRSFFVGTCCSPAYM
jgi:hypothetical protein